jgi:hypothetical protein
MRAAYARFPGWTDGRGDSPSSAPIPSPAGPAPIRPASANLGTLVPDATMTGARLIPGMVPARCGPTAF